MIAHTEKWRLRLKKIPLIRKYNVVYVLIASKEGQNTHPLRWAGNRGRVGKDALRIRDLSEAEKKL